MTTKTLVCVTKHPLFVASPHYYVFYKTMMLVISKLADVCNWFWNLLIDVSYKSETSKMLLRLLCFSKFYTIFRPLDSLGSKSGLPKGHCAELCCYILRVSKYAFINISTLLKVPFFSSMKYFPYHDPWYPISLLSHFRHYIEQRRLQKDTHTELG